MISDNVLNHLALIYGWHLIFVDLILRILFLIAFYNSDSAWFNIFICVLNMYRFYIYLEEPCCISISLTYRKYFKYRFMLQKS